MHSIRHARTVSEYLREMPTHPICPPARTCTNFFHSIHCFPLLITTTGNTFHCARDSATHLRSCFWLMGISGSTVPWCSLPWPHFAQISCIWPKPLEGLNFLHLNAQFGTVHPLRIDRFADMFLKLVRAMSASDRSSGVGSWRVPLRNHDFLRDERGRCVDVIPRW